MGLAEDFLNIIDYELLDLDSLAIQTMTHSDHMKDWFFEDGSILRNLNNEYTALDCNYKRILDSSGWIYD